MGVTLKKKVNTGKAGNFPYIQKHHGWGAIRRTLKSYLDGDINKQRMDRYLSGVSSVDPYSKGSQEAKALRELLEDKELIYSLVHNT